MICSGVAKDVPNFLTIDSIIFSSLVSGFKIALVASGLILLNYLYPGMLLSYSKAKSKLFFSSSAANSIIDFITPLCLICCENT